MVKNGLFPLTEEILYADFNYALDTIVDSSTFKDNDRLDLQLSFDYQNDIQLVSIRDKIISINKELGQRYLKQTSEIILQLLQAHDVRAFFEELNVQFSSKSFFTLIQSNNLFNTILLFSNAELVLFIDELQGRYDSNYKRNQLKIEKNFFNELRNLIIDHFQDAEMTLRKHIFMDFSVQVDTLFEMHENDE